LTYLVFSCLVLSCLVLSCLVLSFLFFSCLASSCQCVSCLVLPCLVVWCGVVSCRVVFYLGLSCLSDEQVGDSHRRITLTCMEESDQIIEWGDLLEEQSPHSPATTTTFDFRLPTSDKYQHAPTRNSLSPSPPTPLHKTRESPQRLATTKTRGGEKEAG
jgi:hypothetical protein